MFTTDYVPSIKVLFMYAPILGPLDRASLNSITFPEGVNTVIICAKDFFHNWNYFHSRSNPENQVHIYYDGNVDQMCEFSTHVPKRWLTLSVTWVGSINSLCH